VQPPQDPVEHRDEGGEHDQHRATLSASLRPSLVPPPQRRSRRVRGTLAFLLHRAAVSADPFGQNSFAR